MFSIKKIMLFGAGAVVIAGIGTFVYRYGISQEKPIDFQAEEVLRFNQTPVYMNEYLLYAAEAYQNYSLQYGDEVWSLTLTNEKGKKATFEEEVKENILEQIRMTKILCMAAEEEGVVLSQGERQLLLENAEEYVDSLKEKQEQSMGISQDLVYAFYGENALANKMYLKITKGMETEEEKNEAFFNQYALYQKRYNGSFNLSSCVNLEQLDEISFADMGTE